MRVEEATLEEVHKQVPVMSAILAHTFGNVYETGGSSGTKPFTSGQNFGGFSGDQSGLRMPQIQLALFFQQSLFPSQFHQLPFPRPVPFVSQTGSGTYNNFRGNNYKPKGKGKKFFSGGNQQPNQAHFHQSGQQLQATWEISNSKFVKFVTGRVIL